MPASYSKITADGLWANNPGLVQLLGLCPLLAVTTTMTNGIALGIATTLVMLGANALVSLLRDRIPGEIRLPVFVLVIASLVTAVDLAMDAYFHDLHRILGIFVPLIVTNCAILARVESFASRNPLQASAADALSMGAGFTLVLAALGGARELVGKGTLLAGAPMLLGREAGDWQLSLLPDQSGLLIAILPPGAFFGLALLIALKNLIDTRRTRQAAAEIANGERAPGHSGPRP